MSGGGGKVPTSMPEGRCYTDQDCLGDNRPRSEDIFIIGPPSLSYILLPNI